MKKISRKISILLVICILVTSVLPAQPVSAKVKASTLMARYNKLKKECKKKFIYDNASQAEMNLGSYEEYKLWDKELNYVYKKIMKDLNEKQKSKLRESELKWIKVRDKKAKQESAENEGGSIYPCIYNSVLTSCTKSRIKWLIKNYAS